MNKEVKSLFFFKLSVCLLEYFLGAGAQEVHQCFDQSCNEQEGLGFLIDPRQMGLESLLYNNGLWAEQQPSQGFEQLISVEPSTAAWTSSKAQGRGSMKSLSSL